MEPMETIHHHDDAGPEFHWLALARRLPGRMPETMRSVLQLIIRLLLGAVLIPLVCAANLLFSIAAICGDLSRWRPNRIHSGKWTIWKPSSRNHL
jgi:hypothetical protein